MSALSLHSQLETSNGFLEIVTILQGGELAAAVAREPGVIVDLAGLEFIDCSGVAALARGRRHARQAGGDLLLAAPQQRVLRVLAITRLVGEFSVHASVEEAAGSAGRSRREAVPVPRRLSKIRWPRPAVRSGTCLLYTSDAADE